MLGVLLLILSLICFFSKKWRYMSYFLYVAFLLDGYGILIDPLLGGVKNGDLALIYTFLVSFMLVVKRKYCLPNNDIIKWFWVFIFFLFSSILYSYFHYKIPVFSILQGGRSFLLILCLPILINISTQDITKLLHCFIFMTITVGVIDLLQIVLQYPILPSYTIMFDTSTGLYRFFNYPRFTEFFLLLSIVNPLCFGKYTKLVMILLIICLIGTLTRSLMLITLLSVCLILYLSGKSSKIVKYLIIFSICLLPFLSIISERFLGDSNTINDIRSVIEGNVEMVDYRAEKEGTFSYRISWVLERWLYLIDRPIGEQFFGLGLISDASELSKKMYDFIVNIIFYQSNMVQQLRSPDIAYGTMLAYLGFGGSVIYLIFYYKIMIAFLNNRKLNPLFLVLAVLMITGLISSLFGDSMSNPSSFALHYIGLGILLKTKKCQIL